MDIFLDELFLGQSAGQVVLMAGSLMLEALADFYVMEARAG